jgi:hypothetical protein
LVNRTAKEALVETGGTALRRNGSLRPMISVVLL